MGSLYSFSGTLCHFKTVYTLAVVWGPPPLQRYSPKGKELPYIMTSSCPVADTMAEKTKDLETEEGDSCLLETPNFSDKMLSRLSTLHQKEELCDYTIIAEGKRFPCHRSMLASVSDYFAAMFMGGYYFISLSPSQIG